MNRWDKVGIPHRGWTCVGVTDLGEPIHTCEMCGQEAIRYVHDMEHEAYPGGLSVGCVCAEKMAYGYDAKAAERKLRNRQERRSAFVFGVWRRSRKGNQYLKRKGALIVVGKNQYGFWVRIGAEFLSEKFATESQAKAAAFEALERLSY